MFYYRIKQRLDSDTLGSVNKISTNSIPHQIHRSFDAWRSIRRRLQSKQEHEGANQLKNLHYLILNVWLREAFSNVMNIDVIRSAMRTKVTRHRSQEVVAMMNPSLPQKRKVQRSIVEMLILGLDASILAR